VAEYLSGRKPGVALDAACGTGRFAEFLAKCGHRVIGVDSSPEMLAYARRRVPDGEFRLAELGRLPLPELWLSLHVSDTRPHAAMGTPKKRGLRRLMRGP
jgi:ubiquinone/menaquinone biosynthesis C-methylase UbiE